MATLKEFASSDGVSKTMDPVATGSSKRPKDQMDGQIDINSETKAEALKNLMAAASQMGKSDIDNIFKGATALGGGSSKRSADNTDKQPITAVQNYWAKEDVDELFAGDQFSEEFRAKILTIFEAAVAAKVTVVEAEILEAANEMLDERVSEIEAELVEQVDEYLSFVAESWVEKNGLEIAANSKVDIAESFMAGLTGLFEAHNIDIDDEQVDLIGELEEQNTEVVEKFNSIYEDNIELRKIIMEYQKADIFAEVAGGLVSTQVDRLDALAESIAYEDLDDFRDKLETLKESVVGKISAPAAKRVDLNEANMAESDGKSGKTAYQIASERLAKK